MDAKHTPTPWEVSAGDVWPVNGNPRVKIADIVKPSRANGINWQANAAFIVRACNAHDELVKALQNAHRFLRKNGFDMTLIDAALAKATGEKS